MNQALFGCDYVDYGYIGYGFYFRIKCLFLERIRQKQS